MKTQTTILVIGVECPSHPHPQNHRHFRTNVDSPFLHHRRLLRHVLTESCFDLISSHPTKLSSAFQFLICLMQSLDLLGYSTTASDCHFSPLFDLLLMTTTRPVHVYIHYLFCYLFTSKATSDESSKLRLILFSHPALPA